MGDPTPPRREGPRPAPTLSDYLKRTARAGLVWPLPEALTDAVLEAMLFQPVGGVTRQVHAQPDWPVIHD